VVCVPNAERTDENDDGVDIQAQRNSVFNNPNGIYSKSPVFDSLLPPSQEKKKPQIAIDVQGLTVKYPDRTALDAVSFQVMNGEIFALLGSNGAGKSTLFSCLARINCNYDGSLELFGEEVKESRERVISDVALVPQEHAFFQEFTVYQNLKFGCEIFNLFGKEAEERVAGAMQEFRLEAFRDIKAKNLSGGYKRLLNLALAMLKGPKVVLLDEPTAGLDVSMRAVINGAIRKLKMNGKTVILTTHYLEDAEEVCDRAVLLSLGKVISVGTLDELLVKKGGPYLIVLSEITGDFDMLAKQVDALPGFEKNMALGGKIYLVAQQKNIALCLSKIAKLMDGRNARIGKIYVREPSLNRVFLGIGGDQK